MVTTEKPEARSIFTVTLPFFPGEPESERFLLSFHFSLFVEVGPIIPAGPLAVLAIRAIYPHPGIFRPVSRQRDNAQGLPG